MRIRKNGKFSPLMLLQSTLGPRQAVPKTICQLNQSPWDVIPLSKEICSPSFHQFGEGDDHWFTGKESFGRSSIGAVQWKPVTRALKGQTRTTNKGYCSSSNANQFYYYSGFGPWRGRRRERGESEVKETCVPVTVNGAAQKTTPNPIPIIYIDDDSEEDEVTQK
uniref:Uncharacterized protein n=1 Tax=Salix viminalis TaxID=40686 RepID=A0A6N2L0M5_SALVM